MARDQSNEPLGKKTTVPAAEPSTPKLGTSTKGKAEPSLKLGTCNEVKVIHISCETKKNIDEAYKKLQEGWIRKGEGVPKDEFKKLAGTKPNKLGGERWLTREEKPDDWLFEDVAFSTHAGAITAPFKSGKGKYHIILVEERKKIV